MHIALLHNIQRLYTRRILSTVGLISKWSLHWIYSKINTFVYLQISLFFIYENFAYISIVMLLTPYIKYVQYYHGASKPLAIEIWNSSLCYPHIATFFPSFLSKLYYIHDITSYNKLLGLVYKENTVFASIHGLTRFRISGTAIDWEAYCEGQPCFVLHTIFQQVTANEVLQHTANLQHKLLLHLTIHIEKWLWQIWCPSLYGMHRYHALYTTKVVI